MAFKSFLIFACSFHVFQTFGFAPENLKNTAIEVIGREYSPLVYLESEDAVQYSILSNGVKMPLVAAGTGGYNSSCAEAIVGASIRAGFTHIDTAHNYYNQDGVRNGIKKSGTERGSLFLTTKIPGCGRDGIGLSSCAQDSLSFFQENLKILDVDYVDLLLVHTSPKLKSLFPQSESCGTRGCRLIRSQWAVLEAIYQKNQTRAIGVSNFCKSCLKCLLHWPDIKVIPQVNQIKYHIGMGADPGGLVVFMWENGIQGQAYSPLGGRKKHEVLASNITQAIAVKHNKTAAQVGLKWVIQNGLAVVTSSLNPEHLKQDMEIFSYNLTDLEMLMLSKETKPADQPSFSCYR